MSRRTEQAAFDRGHKAGAKAGRRVGEMDGWDSGFTVGAMVGGGFVLLFGVLILAMTGFVASTLGFLCGVTW